MSKVDAQRAMREAKYARNNPDGPVRGRGATAAPPAPPAVEPRTTKPAGRPSPAAASAPAPVVAAPEGASAGDVVTDGATPGATPGTALCGHKSMNGRACTREAGHAQKSHRYG